MNENLNFIIMSYVLKNNTAKQMICDAKIEAIKSVIDNIDNNTMISDTNEIYDLIDKEIKSLFTWLIEETNSNIE
jgi:hypothetical protein